MGILIKAYTNAYIYAFGILQVFFKPERFHDLKAYLVALKTEIGKPRIDLVLSPDSRVVYRGIGYYEDIEKNY